MNDAGRRRKNSEKFRLEGQPPCPRPREGGYDKPSLTEGGEDAVEPVDEKHGAEFLFLGGAKR